MEKALVVIDLQNDVTKNYKEIIQNVNTAIDWAVKKDMHVLYVRHVNLSESARTFKDGTRGAEFVSELHVVSENVFTKTKSNALTCQQFADFVALHGITEFFVVGADATACIKSTCFNMAKAGFIVHVFSDCVTSYDKKKLPEMLNYYAQKGCIVESVDNVTFEN